MMPIKLGEGIDMWGPHPKQGKCGNTYCRFCYQTQHVGDQIFNPKFRGRDLTDLSNDELHELGMNKYWASLPSNVMPSWKDESRIPQQRKKPRPLLDDSFYSE